MLIDRIPMPPIEIADGRILNFNQIREWALRNHPVWHRIEFQANMYNLPTWETLQFLAIALLKQNCEQEQIILEYANLRGLNFTVPKSVDETETP